MTPLHDDADVLVLSNAKLIKSRITSLRDVIYRNADGRETLLRLVLNFIRIIRHAVAEVRARHVLVNFTWRAHFHVLAFNDFDGNFVTDVNGVVAADILN